MEEIGQPVMFPRGVDEGVLLEHFDVMLDRPILDPQAVRELVHVSRLDPEGLDKTRPHLAAPGRSQEIPQEAAQVLVFLHEGRDLRLYLSESGEFEIPL